MYLSINYAPIVIIHFYHVDDVPYFTLIGVSTVRLLLGKSSIVNIILQYILQIYLATDTKASDLTTMWTSV